MSKKILIESVHNGISGDSRGGLANTCAQIKHFNTQISSKAISPYRAMETDQENTEFNIRAFEFVDDNLYGLGQVSTASQIPKLYKKDTPDYLTGVWEEAHPSSAQASSGVLLSSYPFKYYKNQSKFYGLYSTNKIFSVTTSAFADVVTLSHSFVNTSYIPHPFVHPDDDNLYFSYDNRVSYKNGGASVVEDALVLPSDKIITDHDKYSGFLAIATKPADIGGKSVVYLWDRTSSDPTEAIDFGEGELLIIANIGGNLYGISQETGTIGSIRGKIVIRQYIGNSRTRIIRTIESTDSTVYVYHNTKNYVGDRVFFGASVGAGDHAGKGVYSFGYSKANSNLTLTLDYLADNDTAVVNNIKAVRHIRDVVFVSFVKDGDEAYIRRTNDQAVYTDATAIVETDRNPNMSLVDLSAEKTLEYFRVGFPPLTSGQSVVLKYKKDDDSSWTTLRTENTVGARFLDVKGFDGTWTEIHFQLAVTGGVTVLMPLEYHYNVHGGK